MARDVSWRVPKRRLLSAPVPEETRTYKPVSHKDLAKITVKAIKSAGFSLDVEEYYTAREGLVANARYTIKDIKDEDMQLEIGWQNSYDKSLSLKFAIGTRIMICANGCVSGNFGAFSKKHMSDVKTFAPDEMTKAIKTAAETFKKMKVEKDAMKTYLISVGQQSQIVGRLFFKEILGSTQLNIIRDEFKAPSHDYKCPDSLWETYQYVTFSMKEIHPRLWMDEHIRVHEFFLDFLVECDKMVVLKDKAMKWEEHSEPKLYIDPVDPQQLDLLKDA